jgi:hypothetical protein
MFEVISANSILVWFVWGFIMALGWTLGACHGRSPRSIEAHRRRNHQEPYG